jgi:putative membrane protein
LSFPLALTTSRWRAMLAAMTQRNESYLQPGDIRVYFAAERTMLAWVRTGVTLMGLGFVVARFGLFLREMASMSSTQSHSLPPSHMPTGLSVWMGSLLLVLGVVMNLHATLRFAAFSRRFRRGEAIHPPSLIAEFTVAALMALMGLLLAVYLVSTQ